MKNVITYILKNLCPVDLCDEWDDGDTVNCLPETEKCAKCWANIEEKLEGANNEERN